MPFIEQALADAKEDVTVPEAEYDLEIISTETKVSKKAAAAGKTTDNMVACVIAIRSDDYPNAAMIFHHIMLVTDPNYEWNHLWLRDQKRFLVVFSVPFEGNGFDTDDLQGCTGRCLVGVEKNERGEDVNVLRLPRVKDEEEEAEAPRKGAARGATRNAGKPARRR